MSTVDPAGAQSTPTEQQRVEFRRSLASLPPEAIRDRVLAGEFGNYDPTDPRKSHWKAREANRLITEITRARELRPQWFGIIISSILSIAALVVAILAYIKQ
jgi:hypothetical protein